MNSPPRYPPIFINSLAHRRRRKEDGVKGLIFFVTMLLFIMGLFLYTYMTGPQAEHYEGDAYIAAAHALETASPDQIQRLLSSVQ